MVASWWPVCVVSGGQTRWEPRRANWKLCHIGDDEERKRIYWSNAIKCSREKLHHCTTLYPQHFFLTLFSSIQIARSFNRAATDTYNNYLKEERAENSFDCYQLDAQATIGKRLRRDFATNKFTFFEALSPHSTIDRTVEMWQLACRAINLFHFSLALCRVCTLCVLASTAPDSSEKGLHFRAWLGLCELLQHAENRAAVVECR